MSSQNDVKCKYCSIKYGEINYQWCKSCRIDYLRQILKNWTSGNEKIDELIQEMQLKINGLSNIIVEWIPYNQFDDIKQISKDDSNTLYSAIWTDGPLEYASKTEYKRMPNKEVTLKCLYNSRNIINEFLNEV
jgi:hypothetical protein